MKCNITYDVGEDRWMVKLDGRKYGLHCGEVFSISIGQHYIPCRLEMDDDWYILLPGARFDLRHKETYKVEI